MEALEIAVAELTQQIAVAELTQHRAAVALEILIEKVARLPALLSSSAPRGR